MFQRKIISELRLWADSKYRKPLVLRGARQVGKSTMVKEFGKEFDVFISLNLEKPDHLAIFESADIDISVKMIFLFAKKPLDNNCEQNAYYNPQINPLVSFQISFYTFFH